MRMHLSCCLIVTVFLALPPKCPLLVGPSLPGDVVPPEGSCLPPSVRGWPHLTHCWGLMVRGERAGLSGQGRAGLEGRGGRRVLETTSTLGTTGDGWNPGFLVAGVPCTCLHLPPVHGGHHVQFRLRSCTNSHLEARLQLSPWDPTYPMLG